jgi:hypothetical protein
VNGVTVQVGPRSIGRRCAVWGLAIARDTSLVATAALGLLAALIVTAVISVTVTGLQRPHSQPAPSHVPLYFCPAGQRMTGTADGWPVCTGDRP